MKKIFISILCFQLFFISLLAQNTTIPAVDKSPMDMSYYPNNFPVLKIQDKATVPVVARVLYSRPQKSGRVVFGDLVKYGEVWRLGANEATEIEFYKPVTIAGKKILKGRYTLYAIVNEANWNFIVNKDVDTWGAFKYDVKKDVARINVPVQKMDNPVDSLAMYFEKTTSGCNLVVVWENIKTALPVTF